MYFLIFKYNVNRILLLVVHDRIDNIIFITNFIELKAFSEDLLAFGFNYAVESRKTENRKKTSKYHVRQTKRKNSSGKS